MFKVALINPPVKSNATWVREGRCQQLDIWGVPFPPLSLGYISSILKSEGGVKTKIFDGAAQANNYQEVVREIVEFDPSLVIMSVSTPTIESDGKWFAELLKKNIRGVRIAVIGIHATALPDEVLKNYPFLDFVVVGEPELTAKDLVICFKDSNNLSEVEGIAFRKNNQVKKTESRKFINCLDSLGFPNWEGINWQNYKLPIVNKPFSLIEFERGCPFSCKFCNAHIYHGRKFRKRSVDKIIEEIYWYLNQNIDNFLFWAESFTYDYDYLNQFLGAIIKNGLNRKIKWACNSRVDGVNKEIFKKMKQAGCWQIAFGLEFGNERILKLANKAGNTTLQQAREVISLADELDIVADGHFIMGFPGENEKTMQDTINFACNLPLTFAHFYCVAPFPGSKLFIEALEKGWLNKKDIYKISQSNYLMNPPGLSPKIVNAYIKKAYKKFYFRPKTIKKILKIPKGFKQWRNLTFHGLKMLANFK